MKLRSEEQFNRELDAWARLIADHVIRGGFGAIRSDLLMVLNWHVAYLKKYPESRRVKPENGTVAALGKKKA